MEISEKRLLKLAAEVDDLHREGMETMADDVRSLHSETRAFRRRTFLTRAGMGGAALTVGAVAMPISRLLPPAAAQSLTDGDIATFAESVELAAVEAYKAAAGSGKLQPAVVTVGTMFAGHHQAHAAAFGGASGGKAKGKANAKLLEVLGPQLSAARDQAAILGIAMDVENMATATYIFALGALQSPAALQLTASILPVESQHAVILGTALNKPLKDLFPTGSFETEDKKIDPAKFPAA